MHLRSTLSYMKSSVVTIRLDPDLESDLDALVASTGQSRSAIVRDAVRRRVAVLRFEEARRQVLPFAEANGYLTDEDVFRDLT
jgi:predicted transcriptional regulator